MKNRTFLLGLGVGLIAGALLLQIMLIGQGTAGSQLVTKQQVKEAAARLDLKVVEGSDQLLTAQEWEAKSKEADPTQPSKQSESKSPDTPKTPASTTKPTEPQSATEPQQPAKPSEADKSSAASSPDAPGVTTPQTHKPDAPKKPETVTYKISSGDTLSKVADGLKSAGVISDKSAFIKKAVDQKSNYSLQTGTYSFDQGESIVSIITKITSKPSGK